jgi:hypothetical protein
VCYCASHSLTCSTDASYSTCCLVPAVANSTVGMVILHTQLKRTLTQLILWVCDTPLLYTSITTTLCMHNSKNNFVLHHSAASSVVLKLPTSTVRVAASVKYSRNYYCMQQFLSVLHRAHHAHMRNALLTHVLQAMVVMQHRTI